MGAASSKAARKFPARGAGFTISPTIQPRQQQQQQQQQQSKQEKQSQAESSKGGGGSTGQDVSDPDFAPAGFASRLQQMGMVEPNPTYSPSSRASGEGFSSSLPWSPPPPPPPSFSGAGPVFPSTQQQQTTKNTTTTTTNHVLSALESRRRIQERADADTELLQREGIRAARRRYVDMRTLADALRLLNQGVAAEAVEARLGMKTGLLARMGRKGVVTYPAR